jgi:hypothetical protein
MIASQYQTEESKESTIENGLKTSPDKEKKRYCRFPFQYWVYKYHESSNPTKTNGTQRTRSATQEE